jgi:hypothetical protein
MRFGPGWADAATVVISTIGVYVAFLGLSRSCEQACRDLLATMS